MRSIEMYRNTEKNIGNFIVELLWSKSDKMMAMDHRNP